MTLKTLMIAIIALTLLVGCSGLSLYDKTQEPVVSVGTGLQPEISWTPAEAYEMNVYAGTEDGNGFGVLWTAKMGDGYENSLKSPVIYGVPPAGSEIGEAPPLEEGKTYTVVITRKDPKRSGDGFTSSGQRYIGKKTFVAQSK